VLVLLEWVPRGGVVEQDALAAAAHVVEDRLRQHRRRVLACIEQAHRPAARRDLRRGPQALVAEQEHIPLVGPGVLEHHAQQRLEQAGQPELPGDALCGLDHRQDVELLGAHGERDGGSHGLALDEVRVALIELLHLGVRAPAEVAGAGPLQVGVGGNGEAARAIEGRGELAGEGLVLDEALLARRRDGLLVEPDRLRLMPLQPRDLGADQSVLVEEVLGAALRPHAEPPLAGEQAVRELLRSFCLDGGERERAIEDAVDDQRAGLDLPRLLGARLGRRHDRLVGTAEHEQRLRFQRMVEGVRSLQVPRIEPLFKGLLIQL
jgi:hypothetical protein